MDAQSSIYLGFLGKGFIAKLTLKPTFWFWSNATKTTTNYCAKGSGSQQRSFGEKVVLWSQWYNLSKQRHIISAKKVVRLKKEAGRRFGVTA